MSRAGRTSRTSRTSRSLSLLLIQPLKHRNQTLPADFLPALTSILTLTPFVTGETAVGVGFVGSGGHWLLNLNYDFYRNRPLPALSVIVVMLDTLETSPTHSHS
jgi:hypothetical protein